MLPLRLLVASLPTSATLTTSRSKQPARFYGSCDFYTIDVAGAIGHPAATAEIDHFVKRHSELLGTIQLGAATWAVTIRPQVLRSDCSKASWRSEEGGRGPSQYSERQGRGAPHCGNFHR
jgi:hypothetical protein